MTPEFYEVENRRMRARLAEVDHFDEVMAVLDHRPRLVSEIVERSGCPIGSVRQSLFHGKSLGMVVKGEPVKIDHKIRDTWMTA